MTEEPEVRSGVTEQGCDNCNPMLIKPGGVIFTDVEGCCPTCGRRVAPRQDDVEGALQAEINALRSSLNDADDALRVMTARRDHWRAKSEWQEKIINKLIDSLGGRRDA